MIQHHINIIIMGYYINHFSDIGGYIFGKIFRWKRLTNISPNKTLSGAIGSIIFSIFSILLLGLICKILFSN